MTVCFNLRQSYIRPLLQRRGRMIVARLKILRLDDLNALFCLDTLKDNVCVYAFSNGCITTGFVVWIKPIGVNRFPKCLIVKAVEPVLQFLLIFKILHRFSLSYLKHGLEGKVDSPSTLVCSAARRIFSRFIEWRILS